MEVEQLTLWGTSERVPVREKQNSQYTYKFNTSMGRHGWLRLTPAYSVKIVEEIISELSYSPKCVFEPFSGTGTTELVCSNLGIPSVAYDINPFLVWFAEVKTHTYYNADIFSIANELLQKLNEFSAAQIPPIAHVERWWGTKQLVFLAKLKTAISSIENAEIQNLLKVAFCRLLISISYAAFNHVSTSFKVISDEQQFDEQEVKKLFLTICSSIEATIEPQPQAPVMIYNADSTNILEDTPNFDTVITSPPYPNRISYIRELRPYMYWLDFLKTSDEASDLDWDTIGGTWGAATSKLATWKARTNMMPAYLKEITHRISKADNKSAGLMANYVLKYFDDIAIHLESIYEKLDSHGSIHYIIGNSNFYGNTVPAERIFVDLMTMIGFKKAKSRIIRKRNCNKALFEFIVSAEK